MLGKAREQNGLRFPHAMHLSATRRSAHGGYAAGLWRAQPDRHPDRRSQWLSVRWRAPRCCHSLVYDKVGSTFRSLRHGDVAQMRADLMAMDRAPRRPVTQGLRRPGEFKRGGRYFQDFGRPARNYTAVAQALSDQGVCGECHIPSGDGGVMPVFQHSDYFLNARFDHEAHEQEDCTTCHAGPVGQRHRADAHSGEKQEYSGSRAATRSRRPVRAQLSSRFRSRRRQTRPAPTAWRTSCARREAGMTGAQKAGATVGECPC